ncbi:MAG: rubrerythrin [Phycisphaerales bacterium]|nr:rubrerythrin [Phycisphaerales bacterium]
MAKTKPSSSEIVDALIDAYNMEIETVMNYIANSVDLDGALAAPIKAALAADVPAELGHAQLVAKRIKTIGGRVPGSLSLVWGQNSLQPPEKTTDLLAVVQGVIDAEKAAIAGYERIIKICEGADFATQDLAIELLSDEQEHLREFLGFQKELEHLLQR